MRVMIGCPVQNRAWILPKYLERIDKLVANKKQMHLAFLINNSTDDTECILRDYQEQHENEFGKISVQEYPNFDYVDNRLGTRDYEKIAEVKNAWLSMRKPKDKFAFMVDSDLLIPPRAYLDLFSVGADVTAGLFPTLFISDMTFYNII